MPEQKYNYNNLILFYEFQKNKITPQIDHTYILVAAIAADKLNMGTELIIKRSSCIMIYKVFQYLI